MWAHQQYKLWNKPTLSCYTTQESWMVGGYTEDPTKQQSRQNWGMGACIGMGVCLVPLSHLCTHEQSASYMMLEKHTNRWLTSESHDFVIFVPQGYDEQAAWVHFFNLLQIQIHSYRSCKSPVCVLFQQSVQQRTFNAVRAEQASNSRTRWETARVRTLVRPSL